MLGSGGTKLEERSEAREAGYPRIAQWSWLFARKWLIQPLVIPVIRRLRCVDSPIAALQRNAWTAWISGLNVAAFPDYPVPTSIAENRKYKKYGNFCLLSDYPPEGPSNVVGLRGASDH